MIALNPTPNVNLQAQTLYSILKVLHLELQTLQSTNPKLIKLILRKLASDFFEEDLWPTMGCNTLDGVPNPNP